MKTLNGRVYVELGGTEHGMSKAEARYLLQCLRRDVEPTFDELTEAVVGPALAAGTFVLCLGCVVGTSVAMVADPTMGWLFVPALAAFTGVCAGLTAWWRATR